MRVRSAASAFCLFVSAASFAGNSTGSGGDPLPMAFAEAREVAANFVETADFSAEEFQTLPSEWIRWSRSQQANLAADIRATPHDWSYEDGATCAYTRHEPKAPIQFHLHNCRRDFLGRKLAPGLLIHESIHHFGIADEDKTNRIALAFLNSGRNLSSRHEVVVTFAGDMDGHDTMRLTDAAATWNHIHWGLPQNVRLNGIPWPDQSQPLINSGPTAFLPKEVQFASATIRNRTGRDIIGLSHGHDFVDVIFNDTPNGHDYYGFELVFRQPTQPYTLRVVGRFDRSDTIVLDNNSARLWHRYGAMPGTIDFGGVTWTPETNAVLPNRGHTEFLPELVNLKSARLEHVRGRDIVVLEHRDSSIAVHIGDNPNGDDEYEFLVHFF